MPNVSEPHDRHDLLLVVSLADGDLTAAERDSALSLVAGCTECAAIHDDILAIARATAALPAPARPRDFQLSPQQAARLRPGGWRRFVGVFASPRLAMTRQLGVGLTTLGLAGLLVSALPTMSIGMGGSASASSAPEMMSATDASREAGTSGAPAAAPSEAAASAAPSTSSNTSQAEGTLAAPGPSAGGGDTAYATGAPTRTSAGDGVGVTGAQPAPTIGQDKATPDADQFAFDQRLAGTDPGFSPLIVVSMILLAAGLALLIARRLARGLTDG